MAKPSSSSFSLPTGRGGVGGGRPKQTSPTGPFSATLHSWFKNRRFKSQVELSHPESQRPGNQEERRKWLSFSLLPYPQTCFFISSQMWVNSEKQMISHEMLKDKSESSPSAGAGMVRTQDFPVLCSCAPELLSRYKQLQPFDTNHMISPTPDKIPTIQCSTSITHHKKGKDEANLIRSNDVTRGAVGQGKNRTQQNHVGLLSGCGPYFGKPDRVSSAVHSPPVLSSLSS